MVFPLLNGQSLDGYRSICIIFFILLLGPQRLKYLLWYFTKKFAVLRFRDPTSIYLLVPPSSTGGFQRPFVNLEGTRAHRMNGT